uniref:Metalloendopeptidase n=1 Tax=Parastrongyloides trichosuri TaxID=131310 RepID=A0A0N5A6X3_PARTI
MMLRYNFVSICLILFNAKNCNSDCGTRNLGKVLKFDLPVLFYIDPRVNRSVIYQALLNIQEKTCIRFERKHLQITNENGINFLRSDKGYCINEHVGRRISFYEPQNIYIDDECMENPVKVQSYVHQALGALPTHLRNDSVEYIRVCYDDILEENFKYFAPAYYPSIDTFGLQYEFASILHVDAFYFAKNELASQKTIEVIEYEKIYDLIIGQRKSATFNDYKYLNFLYCNETCKKFPYLYCDSPGYQNPNNCFSCICPSGKEGTNCELPPKSFKEECPTNDIWVTEKEEKITFSNQNGYYCAVRFLTVSNKRIQFRFDALNFTDSK